MRMKISWDMILSTWACFQAYLHHAYSPSAHMVMLSVLCLVCVCVCVCVFCYHTHVARVAYIPHTVFCTSIFPLCRKRFTDKHNQDVVSCLVSEAGKLDCNIPVIQLRGNHCVCMSVCVLICVCCS